MKVKNTVWGEKWWVEGKGSQNWGHEISMEGKTGCMESMKVEIIDQ